MREVAVGDETWYQHWVAPDTGLAEGERLSVLALDLHFMVFQGVLTELSQAGETIERYKDHEPSAVQMAYAELLRAPMESSNAALYLDRFCRGQFLGNANHRTAILVLVAVAARHKDALGIHQIHHDPAALQTFNACSKAVLEGLAQPHAPRRTLLERHVACCERFVSATPWLQSMARASAFVERFSSALTDSGRETSG